MHGNRENNDQDSTLAAPVESSGSSPLLVCFLGPPHTWTTYTKTPCLGVGLLLGTPTEATKKSNGNLDKMIESKPGEWELSGRTVPRARGKLQGEDLEERKPS